MIKSDKWARGKGFVSGNHVFDKECSQVDEHARQQAIEHRLTAP